jgi:hypothetical protein
MYQNLKNAITSVDTCFYISFIENGQVYEIEAEEIEHGINIGIREFKNAAIYDQTTKKLIPILPIQNKDSILKEKKIVILNWIRLIYSKRYGIPFNSDLIPYIFLIDNMYINYSDVPNTIKDVYNSYAKLFLEKKRYGQDLSEFDCLARGDDPKHIGIKEDFGHFLKKCPNYPMFDDNDDINPLSVWYMILKSSMSDYNDVLLKGQKSFWKDAIMENFMREPNDPMIKRILQNINAFPKHKKIIINSQTFKPNYYCYITLTDIDEEGGFMFYKHKNNN